MKQHIHKRWLAFWACLAAAFVGILATRAAIVDLDALVDFAILKPDNSTPLADGSWVYIIGSSNNISDPMATWGPSPPSTNYIANSVTGDDVILGVVQIGYQAVSNNSGTFYTTVQYDSDQIKYVYIRYFDYTNGTITGLVNWGTSAIYQLGVTLGVSTVGFDPGGSLVASNLNNFVVIPEPSTANLVLLVGGMIWAMRASMRRKRAEDGDEKTEGRAP